MTEKGQEKEASPKRKRGRPRGSRKVPELDSFSATQGRDADRRPEHEEKSLAYRQNTQDSVFSQCLSAILRHNRAALARVALEVGVTDYTLHRWMTGITEPDIAHLKHLLEVLPEHRSQLLAAIYATFGSNIDIGVPAALLSIEKDIYRHVLELMTTIEDADTRFWHVIQALFAYALHQLDPLQQGIALSYAQLMPAHEDGVHSLREAAFYGHEPWAFPLEQKVFLGSTTLVGMAATLQRMQTWSDQDENRLLVDVDEHERSACAVPILRGNRISGVLLASSTQTDFFKAMIARESLSEYAQLLAIALPEQDFQPFSALHLRPFPSLVWQRKNCTFPYRQRILSYAREHGLSLQEAEERVLQDMERELECHVPFSMAASSLPDR